MDKNSDLEFSRIAKLLRKSGLDSDEANELTERIQNMTASSFKNEFDSFKNVVEGKLDTQNTKYNTLIVIASAALTIGLAVAGWLIATGG